MFEKKPIPPLQLISRSGTKHILNELPTEYFINKAQTPSLESYLETLKKLKTYISVTKKQNVYLFNPLYEKTETFYFEKQDIKTKGLTPRQNHLADIILKYIADGVDNNISEIYHELYDFIDNYNDPKDELYYSEILIFEKLLDTVVFKLEEAINSPKNRLYKVTIQEDSEVFTYFKVSTMSREELIQDIWDKDSYGLISVDAKEMSEINGFTISLTK